MGAKQFGARVTRLEDPALLAGRGRFVDDVKLPGLLHACFVRSPHGHAKVVSIDSKIALIMPGVHAVITAIDLPDPMRTQRLPLLLPNPGAGGDENAARAGARRGLLRGTGHRRRDRRHALHRRGRRGGDDRAIRRAAGSLRLPHRSRGHRAARPWRPVLQCRFLIPAGLRRHRRGLCGRRARLRRSALAASRRRHGDGNARGARQSRSGIRPAHGLVRNADAASRPPGVGRSARPRSAIDPHDRARCRRRLWTQGDLLSRRGGDRRGGAEDGPAGEMGRRPARAFSVRDTRTRPVLGNVHRGRRGCKNPRGTRPHAARHRRLCAVGHCHALHCLDDGAGPLCGAGLSARYLGRVHQQGTDNTGARRRPTTGGVRHGAAA